MPAANSWPVHFCQSITYAYKKLRPPEKTGATAARFPNFIMFTIQLSLIHSNVRLLQKHCTRTPHGISGTE